MPSNIVFLWDFCVWSCMLLSHVFTCYGVGVQKWGFVCLFFVWLVSCALLCFCFSHYLYWPILVCFFFFILLCYYSVNAYLFSFLTLFSWIFYELTFWMLAPFPLCHTHSSSPSLSKDAPIPTHPLPPKHPGIPLHWGNAISQDQGLFLLLMLDNDILYYIRGSSHR